MLSTSLSPVLSEPDQGLEWTDCQDALNRIETLRPGQILVVDFDETLFLRNSSQEFIRMARPYFLAALVYKTLELLRPWCWFGRRRRDTRDWFHIMAVTLIFPWTWILWRRHARQMAEVWTNKPLAEKIRRRNLFDNVLSSQGFGPIVRPVLRHMGVHFHKIDACRLLFGFSDRTQDKVKRVEKMIGYQSLNIGAAVTDSLGDSDLLERVRVPLLVEWPVSPVRSVSSHYIPFYYMYKVKHGHFAPILRDMISVDLLLLFLAFSWISPLPLVHAIGLSFFFLSFWLIYEIGYMENDEVAFKLEKDPILGSNFEEKRDYISYVEPWFWATFLACIGGGIFQQIEWLSSSGLKTFSFFTSLPTVFDSFPEALFTVSHFKMVALWMGMLVSMRLVYKFYNYTDKMTRTWVYTLLQSYKSIGFMLISTTNLIGVIALGCQVISRSFGYFLYRWGRREWPGSEGNLVRFLMFPTSLILIGYSLGSEYSEYLTLQALVITVWSFTKAIKPALTFVKNIKHVSNDDWKKWEK